MLVLGGTWARPDYRFRLLFETPCRSATGGSATYAALAQLMGHPGDWINDHEEDVRKALEAARDAPDSRAVTAARVRMLVTHHRLEDLGRIEVPTRVLGVEDHAIVPIAHAHAPARAIPGATGHHIRRPSLPDDRGACLRA